jgi:hypothetical protein
LNIDIFSKTKFLSILAAILGFVSVLGLSPNTFGQSGANTLSMQVQLQPHENEFLAEDGWYEVDSFQMTANNAQELCPTNNCQYDIENGEFSTNSYTGGYVFDGQLKVSVTEGDSTSSKFHEMRADLGKSGSEETPSGTTEILDGDIGFGENIFMPDFEYQVVNGTLEVDEQSPVIFLQGADN